MAWRDDEFSKGREGPGYAGPSMDEVLMKMSSPLGDKILISKNTTWCSGFFTREAIL
jgi:hypothetical protein